jgi:hypothetical protein
MSSYEADDGRLLGLHIAQDALPSDEELAGARRAIRLDFLDAET